MVQAPLFSSSDVDKYINYNYKYALQTSNTAEKFECLNNVLKVDEGNVDALRAIVNLDLETNKSVSTIIAAFESVLKYSTDAKQEVLMCLEWLCNNLETTEHCSFAKQLLRYYTDEIATLKEYLKSLSFKMLGKGFFKDVEYFLNLILSFDQNNPDAYWGIWIKGTIFQICFQKNINWHNKTATLELNLRWRFRLYTFAEVNRQKEKREKPKLLSILLPFAMPVPLSYCP